MPEIPDFESIMQMAQNAQAELQKAQDNLDKIEVEGAAGGGMPTLGHSIHPPCPAAYLRCRRLPGVRR